MAIFHLTAKVISRGKGQSAIAAAAYRSGDRLHDEQADEQKFYTSRAERIVHAEIMAPKDAPGWAHDRNRLWNEVERVERRKDAQLAREIEIALPHELTDQQRQWLVRDFAREAFVRKGYAVDIAIHAADKDSDARNHHAHLMVTRRTLSPDGFSATKDWQFDPKQLGQWREQWANLANRHLERHGHDARIDHRSLKAQGVDREPTVHLGYAANEMMQRGAQSDRVDDLRGVLERNDMRAEIRGIDAQMVQLRTAARAHDQASRKAEIGTERRADSFKAKQDARRMTVDDKKPHKVQLPEISPVKNTLKVVEGATGAVSGLGDYVVNLMAGSSPSPAAEQKADMKAFASDPEARKQQQLAHLAAKRAGQEEEKALGHMRDSMERGEALKSDDIKKLTPQHLVQIRLFGDEAVRQMVDEAQKRSERYWKGSERERE